MRAWLIEESSVSRLVIGAAFIPFIALFCWEYVSAEDRIYTFDFAAYWQFYRRYGDLISTDPTWWRTALNEIWSNDYNPAAVIPLYPFYLALGESRFAYVLAISLLYMLPAAAVAASLATWGDKKLGNWVLAFALALTHLPFWTPTLRGMVDIVGLIFLGLSTLILLRSDFLRRSPLFYAVALGILIWAPFLFRRWYAFSIVAFFIIACVAGIVVRWRDGNRDWFSYLRFGIWLAVSGAITVALALSLQGGLFVRALETSYRDLYAAYQVSVVGHLSLIVSRYGYLIIGAITVGLVYSIVKRRVHVIVCALISILAFALFASTQTLGIHHFLPIAFMLFPAFYEGVRLLSSALFFLPRNVRYVPAYVIATTVFAYGVTPGVPRPMAHTRLLPENLVRPLTLENFTEYERMIRDISTVAGKGVVAVYASSVPLSGDLLRAIEPELSSRLVPTPHIAARDFFNFQMITADVVVVPTTPQTHLAPGSQVNITMPGEMLLAGSGFGAAYERLASEYTLANGVKAYLFRKTRPVTVVEVTDLIDRLVSAYPSWKGRFDRSVGPLLATIQVQLGDVWGQVLTKAPDTLFVHPGATTPTRITLPFSLGRHNTGHLASVAFSIGKEVLVPCPNADGILYSIDVDGVGFKAGAVAPGERVVETLPKNGGQVSVTIDKRQQPQCDHLFVTFAF